MRFDHQGTTLVQVQAGHWPDFDDVQLGLAFDWPRLRKGQTTALLLDWRNNPGMDRNAQRRTARCVLQQVLAAHLKVTATSIVVTRQAGQVPSWRMKGGEAITSGGPREIGISLSHDDGCSLIALRPESRLGVDLLHLQAWPDALGVAELYLGPLAVRHCNQAGKLGPEALGRQFGVEWVRHEAALKCLGLPLTEWHPAMDRQKQVCTVQELVPDESWVAAMAWHDRVRQPL